MTGPAGVPEDTFPTSVVSQAGCPLQAGVQDLPGAAGATSTGLCSISKNRIPQAGVVVGLPTGKMRGLLRIHCRK